MYYKASQLKKKEQEMNERIDKDQETLLEYKE